MSLGNMRLRLESGNGSRAKAAFSCDGDAYRVADRLFGGTREKAYCDELNRNSEMLREKTERLKADVRPAPSIASTRRHFTKPSPIPIS